MSDEPTLMDVDEQLLRDAVSEMCDKLGIPPSMPPYYDLLDAVSREQALARQRQLDFEAVLGEEEAE